MKQPEDVRLNVPCARNNNDKITGYVDIHLFGIFVLF